MSDISPYSEVGKHYITAIFMGIMMVLGALSWQGAIVSAVIGILFGFAEKKRRNDACGAAFPNGCIFRKNMRS